MKKFKLNSTEDYKLEKLGYNKIVIRKIRELVPLNKPYLISLISVTTTIQTQIKGFTIAPATYIDIMKRSALQPETNVPLDEVVRHCKNTTMKIANVFKLPDEVIYEIEYDPLRIEVLKIYVSKNMDGFSFALSPDSRERLLNTFPKAKPARNIFASRVQLNDFRILHGPFQPHFISALTSINEGQLKYFEYTFIDSDSGNKLYSSENLI